MAVRFKCLLGKTAVFYARCGPYVFLHGIGGGEGQFSMLEKHDQHVLCRVFYGWGSFLCFGFAWCYYMILGLRIRFNAIE